MSPETEPLNNDEAASGDGVATNPEIEENCLNYSLLIAANLLSIIPYIVVFYM